MNRDNLDALALYTKKKKLTETKNVILPNIILSSLKNEKKDEIKANKQKFCKEITTTTKKYYTTFMSEITVKILE